MPSVSPENRKRSRRRTRSRSRSISPKRKESSHHKVKERAERRSSRDRNCNSSKQYRSDSLARDRRKHNKSHGRNDTLSHSSDRQKHRWDENRIETIRIKEEPESDNEAQRHSRRQRRQHGAIHISKDGHPSGSRVPVKSEKSESEKPKEKINFGLSGKLAEDTNVYNGVVVKYSEPSEARKPNKRWRLYPFKGDQTLPMMPIHRQSAYLLGRERRVADIPIDHPSCSKQHAVFQFRSIQYTREDGTTGRRIRPYIIDLDSANGTFVNNEKVEPRRYVELLERDVIKFGFSSREYVLLHEGSAEDDIDDARDEFKEDTDEVATAQSSTVMSPAS